MRKILRFFTDILLPLFGVRSVVDREPVTSEEIRATVKATAEGGAIDEQEGEILSNIFDLQETRVKEIMVPRTKMVCIEVSCTIREAFAKAKREGFSRLPVFRKSLDNICGVFYIKDLPRWRNVDVSSLNKGELGDLTLDEFLTHQSILGSLNPGQTETLIRPPFFVYKSRDIGSLLREMTQNKLRMVFLLDEFGGVAGLATTEDIVEEVVGEIEDEHDAAPEPKVEREAGIQDSFIVSGELSLRSLNRELGLQLDTGLADTVSGYVTSLAGPIPKKGHVQEDHEHDLVFEVLEMEGTRIAQVRIRRQTGSTNGSPTTMLGLGVGSAGLMAILMSSSPAAAGGGPSGSSLVLFALLLVVSLIMNGFFNGSETSVVSASTARIEILAQQSDKRAVFIKQWMQNPDRMLGTVLVGTNLMATAAGVAGFQLIRYLLPGREGIQELVNTVVMTFIILLFCEILPKTVFRARADALALRSAPVLRLSDALLRPIVALFTFVSQRAARLVGHEDKEERARIMREELKLLAEMGEEGEQKKSQVRMVHGILNLEERSIARIMTPLVDIVAVSEDDPPDVFLQRVADSGFSRIPVYRERIDNIIGLVHVLDVLLADYQGRSLKPFIRRDIRHEPESRRIFPLLQELTRSRSPMVFVVDEYGGVVGLVTIEDLVEEVMGDIWDEKDIPAQSGVHRISDRVLDCDGKTEIQILNHEFELKLPEGDYVTIAGFVTERLQKIPKKGEILALGRLKILVLDADPKSIKRLRIIRKGG